ncbi:MAG: DUF4091 domain-containing protein [Kiritimatiellae bacterium]|nr:DUF4091 domain-containing protein [Kiritimatiellia bacterium]
MKCVPCILLPLAVSLTSLADTPARDLPEAERGIMNTVDPWGLAFGDQWTRYQTIFAAGTNAPFALGVTHDLVKLWPNKYWFRGETVPAGASFLRAGERWCLAGEVQSFQVAVLPRPGASGDTYRLSISAPGLEATVYRQVFVKTSPLATYPRYASERWPDPLIPESAVCVAGLDCGAFWVDLKIPVTSGRGVIECTVAVSNSAGAVAGAVVPLQVVSGPHQNPKEFPCVAWCRRPPAVTEDQFRDMCALMLEHHVQPLNVLQGLWDPAKPEKFDDLRTFLAEHGQTLFQVDSPEAPAFASLYAHLKTNGWLESAISYSNMDEPSRETFVTKNIPFTQLTRQKYPGLRIFLASDRHEDMDQGCDIWMTDVSASGYDPERDAGLQRPVLWHYYCHLPIHWQMRAPLVAAPKTLIDAPALEARLVFWMARRFGAQGLFYYAGNHGLDGTNIWSALTLPDTTMNYPYGGVLNGNGWCVYTSPDGQRSLPSLRIKILRDGLEDLALFKAADAAVRDGRIRGKSAKALSTLLDPVPGVFVHPHYFDSQPATLLKRREAILRALAGIPEKKWK